MNLFKKIRRSSVHQLALIIHTNMTMLSKLLPFFCNEHFLAIAMVCEIVLLNTSYVPLCIYISCFLVLYLISMFCMYFVYKYHHASLVLPKLKHKAIQFCAATHMVAASSMFLFMIVVKVFPDFFLGSYQD